MRYLLCAAILIVAQTPEAPIRFAGKDVVAKLPADVAAKLPAGTLTQEQGESLLAVSLLDGKTLGPAMLGKYERAGEVLKFAPRFPFNPGATYHAELRTGKATPFDFVVPKHEAKSPPKVVAIYPTADVLPANHLRFYITFDRPMRGGKELFKHIVLLDNHGKEIEEPWLVDEIWDEETNTLILFIHPGRIKWGVELRESMGPVLVEKREYSLVVRGEWTDLDGNKVGKDVVKKFRTVAEDRVRIELADCKVSPPSAGTREPLSLTFPKSIDHRSLLTGLTVTDAKGQAIDGDIAIGPAEKTWSFTPKEAWRKAPHRLNVSPDLEDSAGNTPSKAFEVDLLTPILRPRQNMHFDFAPR
jgi:hypothetical protein